MNLPVSFFSFNLATLATSDPAALDSLYFPPCLVPRLFLEGVNIWWNESVCGQLVLIKFNCINFAKRRGSLVQMNVFCYPLLNIVSSCLFSLFYFPQNPGMPKAKFFLQPSLGRLQTFGKAEARICLFAQENAGHPGPALLVRSLFSAFASLPVAEADISLTFVLERRRHKWREYRIEIISYKIMEGSFRTICSKQRFSILARIVQMEIVVTN